MATPSPTESGLSSLLTRLVSGGQTGVDRAALDVAIQLGIAHGGWCPRGRRSEDGPIPDHYQLLESPSRDYAVRTEQNVIDSDGTLILHFGPLSGGTRLTWKLTQKHNRPVMRIDLQQGGLPLLMTAVREWVIQHQIAVLNVAGPRESSVPGVTEKAETLLLPLLADHLITSD